MMSEFEIFARKWQPNEVVLPCPSAPALNDIQAGWLWLLALDIDRVLWGRWAWWLERLEKRDFDTIKSSDIPKITFNLYRGHEPHHKALKMLNLCVDTIKRREGRYSGNGALMALIDWLSWSLGLQDEAPGIKVETHQELYQTFCLDLIMGAPCDYWGILLSDLQHGKGTTSFYPTPSEVVTLLTDIISEQDGPAMRSAYDPCLGTGRALLEASNHYLLLSGQDIDSSVLKCAKLNFALYVPWAIVPPPTDEKVVTVDSCAADLELLEGLLDV